MVKKGILLIISILLIVTVVSFGKNIEFIINTMVKEKQASGGTQYTEYIAWENEMKAQNPNYEDLKILIDISQKRLFLLNGNELIEQYPIASGRQETPSPIGLWKIVSKDKWSGGFGTRWMGLNVPWGNYGIHGTDKPSSIGYNASAGCIRMNNKHVEDLYSHVKHGTPVFIINGTFGPFGYGLRSIRPGDIGADVREVQARLKALGYYKVEHLDGKYGPYMEQALYEFQKAKNIPRNSHIESETYNALGVILMD